MSTSSAYNNLITSLDKVKIKDLIEEDFQNNNDVDVSSQYLESSPELVGITHTTTNNQTECPLPNQTSDDKP